MSLDQIMLEVVTPEALVFSGKVDDVVVPGAEGEFGVLRGHAALLTDVAPGELTYTADGRKTAVHVGAGFAEVLSGHVTILVESVSAEGGSVTEADAH